MSNTMLKAGLHELTNWESGKPGLQPGLRMTLIGRFRDVCTLKEDEDGRQNITDCMYDMVNDLIFAPDDEKKKERTEEGEAAGTEADTQTDVEIGAETST